MGLNGEESFAEVRVEEIQTRPWVGSGDDGGGGRANLKEVSYAMEDCAVRLTYTETNKRQRTLSSVRGSPSQENKQNK